MLKHNSLRDIFAYAIFHAHYIYILYTYYIIIRILYTSFINSNSKNISVEFYWKKIINQHFMKIFERRLEKRLEKKCVCLILETEENM